MVGVDHEQLTQLLDQHSAALVLYAHQWCRTPEDVVQEAFLRLMRERPAPTNAVGWLYRVVRNGAIDASRAAGRRDNYETSAASERVPWFVLSADDAVDGEAAVSILEMLPIDEREVIVLRLWGGQSFEQIAELIGHSTSTAHRRYEAGIAALRNQMNNAYRERGLNDDTR